MKMSPLELEDEDGTTLLCKHKEVWPPAHARLDDTPEKLRADGIVDEAKFNQIKVWEKKCGLMAMTVEKCPTCPLSMAHNETGQLVPFAPRKDPPTRLPPATRARMGKDRR